MNRRYLGDGVIDVHGGYAELARLGELVETVNPGDGLLHDALDQFEGLRTLLEHAVGGITTVIEDLGGGGGGEGWKDGMNDNKNQG